MINAVYPILSHRPKTLNGVGMYTIVHAIGRMVSAQPSFPEYRISLNSSIRSSSYRGTNIQYRSNSHSILQKTGHFLLKIILKKIDITDMNSSTQTLLDGYTRTAEINLAKNKGLAVLLNIVGLFISILAFVLMGLFTRFVRPGAFSDAFIFKVDLATMGQLLVLVILVAVSLVVHELIHGFFFWVFTRSRPVYALHLAYAYAAAPGWYIPVRQYWIIGLAPLLLIDLAGLLLILLASPAWILLLVFLVAFNTGGSVGDMWVILNSLLKSPACMVNDVGDGVTFYEPLSPSSNL